MVVFQLAENICAVRMACVREIVPMSQLSCPPGTPGLLAGFLNLGGVAVPVLRLARLFELNEQPVELYTPLIVVESRAGLLALLVDRVLEVVLTGSEAAVVPLSLAPIDTFKGCVESVVQVSGRTIQVLALERLLLEKERQCVADFQGREQRRISALAKVSP